MRVAALVLAVAVFFFGPSCTLINPQTGEELQGMPVELFQETVNAVAADIVLANPDGVLSWDDWPSTSFILLNRVATAWQQWDAEQRALEAGVDR